MGMTTNNEIRVGVRVSFSRGMFGTWQGRVIKLYNGRTRFGGRVAKALVRFTLANGKVNEKRLWVAHLAPVAAAPAPFPRLAQLIGDRVVFVGNCAGAHSIDLEASDADRVLAHWAGYLAGR